MFAQRGAGALFVGSGGVPTRAPSGQIIALAARHVLPASYVLRELRRGRRSDELRNRARLMHTAWPASTPAAILKGEKPADLPVRAVRKIPARDQCHGREGARAQYTGQAIALLAAEVIE